MAPPRPEAGPRQPLGIPRRDLARDQNHVDAALTHQPGYRDRIVHVHVADDEGGIDLAMPPEVIEALTLRGQAAGGRSSSASRRRPAQHRVSGWGQPPLGCATAVRSPRSRRSFSSSSRPGVRIRPTSGSYAELVDRPADVGPAGYRLTSAEQRALVVALTELLVAAGARSGVGPGDVALGSPRPEPIARIVPLAENQAGSAPRDAGSLEPGADIHERVLHGVVRHTESVGRALAPGRTPSPRRCRRCDRRRGHRSFRCSRRRGSRRPCDRP